MQAIDWSDFQIFLAIARERQIARAAKSLNIDPTTVGRRLRKLEKQISQTLFEQTRQGQVLTEAGEALFEQVDRMASVAADIAPPKIASGGPAGTLRISVSEGFGSCFLAPRLRAFLDLYPNVTVDLVASSSYLNLPRREADMAIFLSRPQAGPLVARKLAPYRLGLYASPAYLGRHGNPKTADELEQHRLIGYIPDLLSAPELRYDEEVHPNCRVALRSNSINAQMAMLAGAGGIGVLPCFMGNANAKLLRVVPKLTLYRSFWLVMHKDTHQLQKVKAFSSWIQDAVLAAGL